MKVWEYTNNTKIRYGRTLYQIRYIKSDTLGGWVEKTCKISQSEDIFVDSNSMIHGNVSLKGKAQIINSEIFGNTKIEDRSGINMKNCIIFNFNYFYKDDTDDTVNIDGKEVFGNNIRTDELTSTNTIDFQTKAICLETHDNSYLVTYHYDIKDGYVVKVGCQYRSIQNWKMFYKKIGNKHNFYESDFKNGLKILSDAEIFFKKSEKILSDYFGNNYRENGKFAKKPTIGQVFQERS